MTGRALKGSGSLTIAGPALRTSGSMSGAGSTVFNGAVDLSGNGSRSVITRSVTFAGTSTWTNTTNSGGIFQTGSGATTTRAASRSVPARCR